MEIVRRMFAAWASGDRDAARATYDPHAVMLLPVVDSRVSYGLSEIELAVESWRRSWDGWRIDLDETLDAGDHVVVIGRQHGVGKDTGAEVMLPTAMVFSLRNSKIIRGEAFDSRDEALEAAGLSK